MSNQKWIATIEHLSLLNHLDKLNLTNKKKIVRKLDEMFVIYHQLISQTIGKTRKEACENSYNTFTSIIINNTALEILKNLNSN